MSDWLAQIVDLLQPRAPYSKLVTGYGGWSVSRAEVREPHYFVLLEGCARFTAEVSIDLREGDFVLCPAAAAFTMQSIGHRADAMPSTLPVRVGESEFRLGQEEREPVRFIVGTCEFASYDASLLVSLLPKALVARDQPRFRAVVELLRDEALAQRPAREVVVERLLEILLIEALRAGADLSDCPGLLRGLLDQRISNALRSIHRDPAAPWTVTALADNANLSRSAFHERFTRTLGVPPMEYVISWRLALAKRMLRTSDVGITEVAERVGYGSVSAFSVAFNRQTGMTPSEFVRTFARDRVSSRATRDARRRPSTRRPGF